MNPHESSESDEAKFSRWGRKEIQNLRPSHFLYDPALKPPVSPPQEALPPAPAQVDGKLPFAVFGPDKPKALEDFVIQRQAKPPADPPILPFRDHDPTDGLDIAHHAHEGDPSLDAHNDLLAMFPPSAPPLDPTVAEHEAVLIREIRRTIHRIEGRPFPDVLNPLPLDSRKATQFWAEHLQQPNIITVSSIDLRVFAQTVAAHPNLDWEAHLLETQQKEWDEMHQQLGLLWEDWSLSPEWHRLSHAMNLAGQRLEEIVLHIEHPTWLKAEHSGKPLIRRVFQVPLLALAKGFDELLPVKHKLLLDRIPTSQTDSLVVLGKLQQICTVLEYLESYPIMTAQFADLEKIKLRTPIPTSLDSLPVEDVLAKFYEILQFDSREMV